MKIRLLVFAVLLLALALPSGVVQADTGPKPEMNFIFEYEGDPLQIVSGEQLECQDEQGSDCQPLPELGPQGMSCTAAACSSMAYSYAPYHKLVIEFSDKKRESNVFATAGFNSTYKVAVGPDALTVTGAGSSPNPLSACIAMPLSLVAELIVALIYLLAVKKPLWNLGWVLLVNALTLPAVWFGFPLLGLPALWTTILSELFAFAAEAVLLRLLSGGRLSWGQAAALSLLMNAASFSLGFWLNLP